MGLLGRISDLLKSNINDLIARAEDPEKLLNAAIEEMQKQIIEATVRIRSRHPGVRSEVRATGGARVEIEFAEPQRGVTPGQAAVFYDGSRVLGGCWIETAL